MSYINTKSRRSFDFYAPYNEEGERVVRIPFPVAVNREVTDNGITHDVNPALVTVKPASAETIEVETLVQPGSLMIVRNEGAEIAKIGGADCEGGKVSTLLFDGNGYVKLASSDIA